MRVNEVFDSIQGEGPQQGQCARFIRLQGCNLRCAYCDTVYAQEKDEGEDYDDERVIAAMLAGMPPDDMLYIFTGGEPLLQQQHIINMLRVMYLGSGKYPRVSFETNGTVTPSNDLLNFPGTVFVVSPKIDAVSDRVLGAYHGWPNVWYKFIVGPDSEWNSPAIIDAVGTKIPRSRIYLMPQGATREDQLKNATTVWNMAVAGGFSFSLRQHVCIFDDQRGV